ncbi:hypothetical protein CF319_g8731 [Tilletia indica]|nr:hypothetical protein CF319_g8731 [Tilletia indica]
MVNTSNCAALRAASFAADAGANAGAPLIAVHARQGQPDHAYIQLFKKLTEVKEKLAVSDALNRSKDEHIASLYGQIRRLQSNDRGKETREMGKLRREIESLQSSTNETIAALKAENAALAVRASIVYESGYRAPTWPGTKLARGSVDVAIQPHSSDILKTFKMFAPNNAALRAGAPEVSMTMSNHQQQDLQHAKQRENSTEKILAELARAQATIAAKDARIRTLCGQMRVMKRRHNDTIDSLQAEITALKNREYEPAHGRPDWTGVIYGAGPSGSTIGGEATVRLPLGIVSRAKFNFQSTRNGPVMLVVRSASFYLLA